MTLIVEDGSVVANADSYQDLATARADAANRGLTLSSDDAIAETQLRQAYYWLVTQYESRLQGFRISADQTGSMPRNYVYAYSFAVAADSIPWQFIFAQTNAAASVNAGADLNAIKIDANLKSFEVVGVYKEEYQDNSSTPTLPYMPAVADWLYPFTNASLNGGGLYRSDFGGQYL